MRRTATIPPSSQVLTDTGVPIALDALENAFWSPVARRVDLDHHFFRRTIKVLSNPTAVLTFDLRASSGQIKPERRTQASRAFAARWSARVPRDEPAHHPLSAAPAQDFTIVADGRANAVVFWFDMPMGDAGVLTTAPQAARLSGQRALGYGQALQYLPPMDVKAGTKFPLEARAAPPPNACRAPQARPTDATHAHAGFAGAPQPHSHHLRQPRACDARAAPRPLAAALAAVRAGRALQPHDGGGAAQGDALSPVSHAAAGSPRVQRHRHAIDRCRTGTAAGEGLRRRVREIGGGGGDRRIGRAAELGVRAHLLPAERRAKHQGERCPGHTPCHPAQYHQVARGLHSQRNAAQAHEELTRKADVILIEALDSTLIGSGILHYIAHMQKGMLAEGASILPAAAVVKGMLIERRSGEMQGVDMTMSDAYRWTKEVRTVHLNDGDFVQMSEVFDMFVFDFAHAAVEQQVENLEVIASRDGIVSALVFWCASPRGAVAPARSVLVRLGFSRPISADLG